ncbi:preprotein translocase subunit SecE [Bacillus sp. GM2]|jgi:preprotein translocase subunit SecE|uniref:Protein translocase subunit SecE n=5 Tax=Bacillus TaxID=1386 RepID=SECE_BACLI|nr:MULTISPECIES: preprotein translocase subunit SecE [Bacillus]P38381.1 RecName: Full=Protein translocase subunit SecE [Bacillus licheniformis]ETB72036.1 preprotein translocase subunit SecE [Bacillus sp. CPSM8]KJD55315.1 preprotein translocase subunit SecE [Bacillus amyloliquefaciens]KUL13486.1 preprotein translocase subunit SecE [Bacillus licheniformis LMG 7559]KUL17661.1 preprotein translocase subunit SecE [Bacillus licheniformis LMG 6934]MBC8625047.1 preprotein translocase subunit SecE [Ro
MGIIKFLKNVGKEMKKVTWPKGKELTRYTITVITTVIFFAIFFALIDSGITQLIRLIVE